MSALFASFMVSRPKTNIFLEPTLCTICIHLEALGASECMHVVHSVGFRTAYHMLEPMHYIAKGFNALMTFGVLVRIMLSFRGMHEAQPS